MASVVTDTRIDPDQMMLEGIDTFTKGPLFTVSEMAKVFFARTNHWIRWLEQNDKLMLDRPDGERVEVGLRRNDKKGRVYTLSDIEEIAHALAQNGAITGSQLRLTLLLVKVQAQMNQYL